MKITHVRSHYHPSDKDLEVIQANFTVTKLGLKCKYCGSIFWSIPDALSHYKVCRARRRWWR